MDLVIMPTGEVRCIYAEVIDLHQLGSLTIRRASYVEPTADDRWQRRPLAADRVARSPRAATARGGLARA